MNSGGFNYVKFILGSHGFSLFNCRLGMLYGNFKLALIDFTPPMSNTKL